MKILNTKWREPLILFIPLITIGVLITGAITLIKFSPCDTPLTYKIGSVDPRFGLTQEVIQKDISQAGEIWSKAYGKNLFELNSKGELTVNFVYDERQILNTQINNLQGKIDNEDAKLQAKIDDFNRVVAKFKSDIAALNTEIEDWNKKGGAPEDVYNSLKKRQQDLESQAKKLNEIAKSLNQSTASYNKDVNSLNNTINQFNATITQKPEEGLYNPNDNSINVYFATNKAELIHTLAHELGHAIGLEHAAGPKSIMYQFTNQILTPSKEDLDELKYACRQRSIWQIFNEKIKTIGSPKN